MKVRVIRRKNQAILVEYGAADDPQRVTVPASSVTGDECDDQAIEYGMPYGLEWSKVVRCEATPHIVERELHRRGIWTFEDLLQHPTDVQSAISASYGLDVATLIRFAREVTRNG